MKEMVTVILNLHHTIFAGLLRLLKMRQREREVSYASSFIFHDNYVVLLGSLNVKWKRIQLIFYAIISA